LIRIAPLAAALAVAACGAASEPSPKEAAAERAYSAGRYLEAARRFSEAAAASPRAHDREEARYRQAMSLQRAGRPDEARAVLEAMQKTFPRGARAPRAAYDAALIDIGSGRESDGYRALDALVRRYPDSGPASAALRRYLEWLGKNGEDRVRAYLEELRPKVAGTELVQYVDYEHARSLERGGATEAARAEYLRVADRYPYPRGVFWDDSLFRAAELEAARGAPREAIAHLERLLADREPAIMQGTYERPRYAQAQFRIGELYRDALHDRARAREAFERMWATNATSRLRDDAAWSAAVIAADSGDTEGACRDLRSLIEENPESRYVPCAPSLCPALRAPSGRPCHEYLLLGKGGP
jgi:tetratricopeptide (TPR) repeat protein